MSRKTPVREFALADIKAKFTLAAIPEFNSPAIGRRADGVGGWYIRVSTGMRIKGNDATETFDYFYVDPDGTITTAPRGYAKDYRPGRITDLASLDGAS